VSGWAGRRRLNELGANTRVYFTSALPEAASTCSASDHLILLSDTFGVLVLGPGLMMQKGFAAASTVGGYSYER